MVEHKELKVVLGLKVLKGHQVVVLMVHKVLQEHKVPKGAEELQGVVVHKEPKVLKVMHRIRDIKIILSNLKMLLIK